MSNHNYSQYSKKNETPTIVTPEAKSEPEITMTPAVVEAPEVKIEETTKPVVEALTGVVANCTRLNVRARADMAGAALCVLQAGAEIFIDIEGSTSDWYKVHTAEGVDGYCMRKFINANL